MAYNKEYMKMAIQIAENNVKQGTGGPFGALVVRDGVIIAAGGNTVVPSHDPTAHAEVNVIREACRVLGSHQLTGCDIYTSCEPCPMCLGAIYWARPDHVYYASTKEDAADAGFDDSFIYEEIVLDGTARSIPFVCCMEEKKGEEFLLWKTSLNKVEY